MYSDPNITAKVICDSVNEHGNRLTTFIITYPRIIIAEVNTHKMISKSTASSRAIPIRKQIDKVRSNMFHPSWIGAAQSGMQASSEVSDDAKERFKQHWMLAAHTACQIAETMDRLGIHKQIVNRVLEPFLYVTSIVTGTEWANFFKLRAHCYSDDTEVLTDRGWLLFKNITKEDKVYTLNKENHNVELTNIKEQIRFPIDETIIHISGQSVDMLTTRNHKHYISTDRKNKKFSLAEIENIDSKSISIKKDSNGFIGSVDEVFTFRESILYNRNNYADSIKEILPERNVNIRSLMSLIGFYISDGWCSDTGYCVSLCKGNKQTLNKYRILLEDITGKESTIKEKGSTFITSVNDKQLHNLLSNLGSVLEKHIPKFVWKYDKTILRFLYEGLIDGDSNLASLNNTSINSLKYYTSSYQLANDIQRLLIMIGDFSATISIDDRIGSNSKGMDNSGKEYNITTKNISYRVGINRSKNTPFIKTSQINNINYVKYNGDVFCLEAEKNNVLYVRRNGKCCWSGNSSAQPEFQALAFKMLAAYCESKPRETKTHIPFGDKMEPGLTEDERMLVACARCARISYDTHDNVRDPKEDLKLAARLIESGHFSPFEHVAKSYINNSFVGNLRGWMQYRKLISTENVIKMDYEKLLLTRPSWI